MKTTNTTKTASIIILDETHVQVTKAFAKNARIFGTTEYKTWRAVLKDLPGAEMVTKTIKKNPNKTVDTRNMTYEHMAMYIRQQDNAAELMVTFEKTVMKSKVQNNPYRYVLGWFMTTFEKDEDYKAYFKTLAEEAKQQNNLFALDTDADEEEQN